MFFRQLAILFALLLSTACHGQEKRSDFSQPVELNQTGVTKVLCLKNGSTMLFHLEPHKPLVVKVFDSLRRETASKEHLCRILDLYKLKVAVFKGLYDINDEGVLFMEQEHLSKVGLVRLRFNSKDGSLIEEALIVESKSQNKQTESLVIKNRTDSGYALFLFYDNHVLEECNAVVGYYNSRHEKIREVTLEVDRKNYDYVRVAGADIQANGISISLTLSKLKADGTGEIQDQYLAVYFIPNGSNIAKMQMVNVTADVYPFYTNYAYNPFAQSLNILLLSYKQYVYSFGLAYQPGANMANLFFKLDEATMALAYKQIKNELANKYVTENTNSANFYVGLPAKLFTNENGLSTLVSEYCFQQRNLDDDPAYGRNSYIGNIGITQFDDDGNEIWGIVLPKAQFQTSMTRYYNPLNVSKRWQQQMLFNEDPESVYNRQFVSMNTYYKDKDFYFIYNDVNKNFNNSISHVGDTVYSFDQTNTCYYKINRKKEVTKNYLFGEPAADEFKTSFIEGADFDEQRGVYAALVRCKKGDDVALRMAWRHLD